jgi:hypothetical protein
LKGHFHFGLRHSKPSVFTDKGMPAKRVSSIPGRLALLNQKT